MTSSITTDQSMRMLDWRNTNIMTIDEDSESNSSFSADELSESSEASQSGVIYLGANKHLKRETVHLNDSLEQTNLRNYKKLLNKQGHKH